MQAIEGITKSHRLARVLKNASAGVFNSAGRVTASRLEDMSNENSRELISHQSPRRHFYSVALFSGNTCGASRTEFYCRQVAPSSMMMPNRFFSSEARATENDSADAETVKGVYDKLVNCVTEKRTAPPNAWLWSLITKCSTQEDIELLFDILKKLRKFRLSNLRIPDDFNSALCREITKACVRAGAIDFGMKTLWKHNLFGLTPDIGSAHILLLHAKQHNDVKLMTKIMKHVKINDLPPQPGTADIVFSICYNADKWDLMCKNGKRFVLSGVKLRQSSFELWMEFAAKKGDVDSLWKIEKWRSKAMKQHSLSTGFSCAKGLLLEHKPDDASAIIQVLYQTSPDARKSSVVVELQKLVSEWPLDVIKHQKENKQVFAEALQSDISQLLNALRTLGVKADVNIQEFAGKETLLS
ncbi:adenylyl cyclase [Striga asiatica]|uniref:Adenylyl cyclase n=1 Tax=Striga asiatica TaxID=4170 RepID=A0A5A7RGS6_STRAF|nr:adenylyl cyclase [Striga asiatica]